MNKPSELLISPEKILMLSKTSVTEFHSRQKELIKETGFGLWEYVELLSFIEKVKKAGSEDKEFIDMVREEVGKYNGKITTSRGVKIELAETGTAYDFSLCNDSELVELERSLEEAKEKLDARKEFLKNIPSAGVDVITSDGEVIKIYPPSKSSKSSYKVTLPK